MSKGTQTHPLSEYAKRQKFTDDGSPVYRIDETVPGGFYIDGKSGRAHDAHGMPIESTKKREIAPELLEVLQELPENHPLRVKYEEQQRAIDAENGEAPQLKEMQRIPITQPTTKLGNDVFGRPPEHAVAIGAGSAALRDVGIATSGVGEPERNTTQASRRARATGTGVGGALAAESNRLADSAKTRSSVSRKKAR